METILGYFISLNLFFLEHGVVIGAIILLLVIELLTWNLLSKGSDKDKGTSNYSLT